MKSLTELGKLKHSWFEDIYAFAIGSSFIALGMMCLKSAELTTGGMAGIALIVSYYIDLNPGLLFNLLNIPFFVFAYISLGLSFMIKSIIVSVMVAGFSAIVPHAIKLESIDPLFAALFGGTVIGMGILSIARHGAGVGAVGIFSIYLQKRYGWNIGRSQLIADGGILLLSMLTIPMGGVLISVLSAFAINLTLMVYHRADRYRGF